MIEYGRSMGGLRYVAIAALLSNGCSYAITYGGPKKQVVRYETRKQTVTVRTVPSGATVSDGHAPPRVTPTALEASFQVKLVHRERREVYPFIGLGFAVATFAVGGFMLRGEDKPTLGWVLIMLGMVDGISFPNRFASFRRANEGARLRARESPVPRPLALEVQWPNEPPHTASVNWPEQRFITVSRTRPATFDEALIAWAETGERTPSAEGLFNLGSAYAARAIATGAAGAAVDTRKALDYFKRYLKTANVSDARRTQIDELSRPLRGVR